MEIVYEQQIQKLVCNIESIKEPKIRIDNRFCWKREIKREEGVNERTYKFH